VINFFDHFLPYHIAEFFQIDYEACVGIRRPSYCNDQIVVVAMPVFIGARAKYFLIFLFAPGGVIELMGCVEMFFSANVDHSWVN